MTVSVRVLVVAAASLLVMTGCRTYGNDKYDTGPKTYQAIQQTVQQMEQELGRARSDLRQLEAAAKTMDTLRTLTARYRSHVESHEAALAVHRDQAERLSAGSSYRTLHRTYGAMVTDRRLLDKQYRRTVRAVWATVRDTTVPRRRALDPSRYVITPINFPRVGERGPISMAEALRPVDGTPGLQREEASPSP
jgi:hypothetical protein